MEKNLQMHQEPVFKKWLNAKNYLLALAMLLGGQGNSFAQSPDLEDYNCKLFPAETLFGDVYADTTKIKNPDDIAAIFTEYGINFEIGTLSNYQMGVSLDDYFDSVPDFGNTLKSNYLFYDNPNGSAFSLGFPAKANSGKTYKYKMRIYVQAKNDCKYSPSEALANAKIRMKTQHGSQDTDNFEVIAYDLQGNALKGSDNEVIDGKIKPVVIKSPNTGFSLSQVLNIDSVKPSDIICLDVCSYGVFSETVIGLENFKLTYELAQFECSKVAVEYFYTEYETYCISSATACKGDSVKVHAAGFPRNSTYEWYKQNGTDRELLENVSGTGDEYAKATIYVDYVGAVRYKLAVSNDSYFASTRELEFNVYGAECHSSLDCELIPDINVLADADSIVNVYTVDGALLKKNVKYSEALMELKQGFYIIGNKKVYISK